MQPDSDQFEVYRGLKLHSGNNFNIDTDNVGMHWSSDPKIAQKAAGIEHMPEAVRVLRARVSKGSVETDPKVLKDRFVQSSDHFEKEVPVKEKSPIQVLGVTEFKERSKGKIRARTRNYNPPKEMRA
jgi:hypothetical protein